MSDPAPRTRPATPDAATGAGAVLPPPRRVAAAMLITDPDGRVLIVDPTYKPRWELPGGMVEADESPTAAAAREIHEELGLTLPIGALLALDYVPATDAVPEGLMLVFDGGQLTEPHRIVLPPDEIHTHAFVDPHQLDHYLPALQTRRTHAALHARATATTAYLENGSPTGS